MSSEKTYHLINDYLSGELKGSKLDKFKADLKTNPELQKEVEMQSEIIAAINANREAEIRALLSASKKSSLKVIPIGKNLKLAMATAASIALLVVAFFTLSPYLENNQATTVKETADKSKPTIDSNLATEDSVTTVDTQTLAIVTPASEIDLVEPELQIVDDELPLVEMLDEEIEEPESAEVEKYNYTTEDNDMDGTPESLDDVVVATDVMLSNRSYSVLSISPNFDSKELSSVEIASESTRGAKIKIPRRDKKKGKDKALEEEEEKDEAESTTPSTAGDVGYSNAVIRNVNVEYWKSVVNFKGYKYDGTNVKLYGIEKDKPLLFKELDDRLYMRVDGKQYFIEKKKTYKRLVEVTNPTLLNVLNE